MSVFAADPALCSADTAKRGLRGVSTRTAVNIGHLGDSHVENSTLSRMCEV